MSKSSKRNDNGNTEVLEHVETLGTETETNQTEDVSVSGAIEARETLAIKAAEVKADYDAEKITWEEVANLVKTGELHPEDFQSITGLEYERMQGDEPSADTFQAFKMSLEEKIAAKQLTNDQAIDYVKESVDLGRISEDEGGKLLEYLGDTQGLDPIKAEIEDNYHLANETVEAVREAAKKAYQDLMFSEAQQKTTIFARFVNVFADYAVLLSKAKMLKWTNTVADQIWQHAQKDKILGDVYMATDEGEEIEGVKGQAVIDRDDPYMNNTFKTYRADICMAAALLAYGHRTKAHFAWVHRSKVPNGRVDRNLVFDRTLPEREPLFNESEYFRAVCVPRNVIYPHRYQATTGEKPVDGKLVPCVTLVPIADNTDETSCYLARDLIKPLFSVAFDHHIPDYYLESITKDFPSGALKGSHREGMPETQSKQQDAAKAKRQTGGTQKVDPKDDKIAALEAEKAQLAADRDAAMASNKSDILSGLRTLGAYIRDKNQPMPDEAVAEFWHDAHSLLSTRMLNGKPPSKEAMIWITKIATMFDSSDRGSLVRWDDEVGKWQWCDVDGNIIRTYDL